jgi:eukaryotic-like serine/threonine-protein kinase
MLLNEGDSVGDYKLIKFLGKGEFGVVWLAEKQVQFSSGKLKRALKFLSNVDEDAQPEINAMVEADGHQNVMSVIDTIIYNEHIVIVSDYAEGGSLKTWLNNQVKKDVSIENILEMMVGILRGIEHLHSCRIIHRDLKPANILIQKGFPRIADFGISRIVSTNTDLTKPMGSPAYMSPEAFDGSKSQQTDIWSAGVIFYEMLFRKQPFHGETISQLRNSIIEGQFVIPQTTPQDLRQVIEKALHTDLQQRYQTIQQMRVEVENILHKLAFDSNFKDSFTSEFQKTQSLIETVGWEEIARARQKEIDEIERNKIKERILRAAKSRKRKFWIAATVLVGSLLCLMVGLAAVSRFRKIVPAGAETSNFEQTTTNTFNSVTNNTNINSNVNTNINAQSPAAASAPEIELVEIAPGSFFMGSEEKPDEQPIHRVNIGYSFFMSKYEITQAQWKAVMGENPSVFKDCGERCPVENISWSDAKEFIKKLNNLQKDYKYRLPTEAEWEFACRAGSQTPFSFPGNKLKINKANFDGRDKVSEAKTGGGEGKTVEVGKYEPNSWGLYDMHGNLWEWCEDVYNPTYEGLASNGTANLNQGNPDFRVMRGGSWNNFGVVLHSSNRRKTLKDNKAYAYGLRLVAEKK